MPKMKDTKRVLQLLFDNGPTSNYQIRSKLDLNDQRYDKVRQRLLDGSFVKKYCCRGGGIQLTETGEQQIAPPEEKASKKELAIYTPFIEVLEAEKDENEELAVLCDTSGFKKRGKWANPDVVKISIQHYPLLGIKAVALTTYEIKPKDKWNSSCVYEAASHGIFSNEAYVVIERDKDSRLDGLEDIVGLCGQFGVGLITLHPFYTKYRYIIQHAAEYKNPPAAAIEEYLDYIFERLPAKKKEFDELKKEKL